MSKKAELYVGTHFQIKRKVLTIGAIEKEIEKAVKEFNGKKVLLMVSKEINSLCKINDGYDEEGFGVFKMQIDDLLKEKEFILTDLTNKKEKKE